MVPVPMLFALIQTTAGDAASAREDAWRAAGIREEGVLEPSPQQARLRVRGFFDVAWRTGDRAPAFLPLPGTEACFGERRRPPEEDGFAEWRKAIAPLAWPGDEPVLRLVEESGGRAAGRVRLAPPTSTGDPARAPGQTRVDEFSGGCMIEPRFALPVTLAPEGVELEFAWDLHSPVRPDGLRLWPTGTGGDLPSIALELATPTSALRVEPDRLAFSPHMGARVQARVIPRPGSRSRLEALEHPECIRLARVEHREEGWELTFEARPLGYALHDCRPARVDVLVGDDTQPYSRFIDVRHGERLCNVDGAPVVAGVFAPGEQVEVWSDGTDVRWCLPDRLPCAPPVLEASRWRRLDRFEVPLVHGPFERRLTTPDGGLHVMGIAIAEAFDRFDGWTAGCRR